MAWPLGLARLGARPPWGGAAPGGLSLHTASLALKLVLAPLLIAQARATRPGAPVLPEAARPREGGLGHTHGPAAVRVLIAGDSSAAGVGVARQDQSVARYLSRALHQRSGRTVHWTLRARSGLTTRQAHAMLCDQRPPVADVAVRITGVNDVIDQVPSQRAVRHREALADRLLGGAWPPTCC